LGLKGFVVVVVVIDLFHVGRTVAAKDFYMKIVDSGT